MIGQKENVAVMVHNDVIKDARVRKEIRTLVSHGYIVDVYGVTTEPRDTSEGIDGCNSFNLIDLTENHTSLGLSYKAFQILSSSIVFIRRYSNRLRAIVMRHKVFVASLIFCAGVYFNFLTSNAVLLILAFAIMVDFFGSTLKQQFFENIHIINRKLRYQKIAAALFDKISKKNYDFVHCHDLIALIAGVRYKKKFSETTFIWDAHELYEEISYSHPAEKKFIRKLISSAVGHVDKFITISENFKDIYASRYPLLPPALVVMNATWPQPSLFKNSNAKSPLRSQLRLAHDQKVLLFQGGFSPNRGIKILLEAAVKLPKNWTMVFMGWGKLENEILLHAETFNDSRDETRPAIKVMPPVSQEELQKWTAGATLGAIPYENTNMNHLYCTPNKLWEYPNSSVPILATDLIEMGQVVRTWNIGTLLPRDFTHLDVLSVLNNVNDAQLDVWKTNCHKFSSEMSWSKFEPVLLQAYTN